MARTEFLFDKNQEPHLARTKEILAKHPEMRKFIGKKNPWSFLVILLSVSVQLGMAWFMRDKPLYIVIPAAWLFGTLVNHCFIGLVHDASHGLIFRGKFWNDLAGLIVNSPMLIPSYVSFKKYHMKHHAFQGVYELDADLPAKWEVKAVKNIWYRKMIWLAFFPLIQSVRTARVREVAFFDGWVLANWIVTFAVDFAVAYFWGWHSIIYIAVAFWCGFGLSIVGGRLIQEHFMVAEPQETYSYYGWLSLPSMHVGYHNEHHDFPSCAWNYLPKIRKAAPEFYNNIKYHTSWGLLVLKFIFDKNMSLANRVERRERGGVALDAEVIPDVRIAEA
ncbi:MAG: fatty acid desaturase [Spirochaetes bacterium]|nr:fatty acid desaturase [Spirochaetota bacterium]